MNSPDSIDMTVPAVIAVIVLFAILLYWCCRSNRDGNVGVDVENPSINEVPKYYRFDDGSFEDIERDSRVPTLDLHYLSKKEALEELEQFINESKENASYVRVITGRGLHSKGGKPVIKPAVEARLAKKRLRYWCSKDNPGLIHVTLP